MNSSTSEAVWPTPGASHETALHIANSQPALIALVATNILSAVSTGAFTVSMDVSAQTSVDTQYVVALLNQGNYQAQVTGTNLVINW